VRKIPNQKQRFGFVAFFSERRDLKGGAMFLHSKNREALLPVRFAHIGSFCSAKPDEKQ